jgi:hypothetical protein
MFETPPLEINFLRKASSYAQDMLETSAFSGDLSVDSSGERPLFLSPLQNQVSESWGRVTSPRFLSPTRWKFSNTHGMTS